jgi:hypothetical protein
MRPMDDDEIVSQLKDARDACDEARAALTAAQGRVGPARERLYASVPYKALEAAKATVAAKELELAAARERHDAIEKEFLTGYTGLVLFDAGKSKEPAMAGVVR